MRTLLDKKVRTGNSPAPLLRHKSVQYLRSPYVTLKKEFEFKSIKHISMKAKTLSFGERQLITKGKVNIEQEIPIIFTSILMN